MYNEYLKKDRPLFTLEKVCKFYPLMENPALKIENFVIPKVKILTILGNSGCGKTTLFKLLGLLDEPYPLFNETILKFHSSLFSDPINYQSLYSNNYSIKKDFTQARLRLNHFGFLFQDEFLLNHLDITSNVEIPMLLKGVNKSKRKKSIQEMIDVLELSKKTLGGKKSIFELSKGERQRVALLRSCLHDPEVILADEPTGNLDEENSEWVFQILSKWSKLNENRTVLIITHDSHLAMRHSDCIIVFNKGGEYFVIPNELYKYKKVNEKRVSSLHELINANNQTNKKDIINYLNEVTDRSDKIYDTVDKKLSNKHSLIKNKINNNQQIFLSSFQSLTCKITLLSKILFILSYSFFDLLERPQLTNSSMKNFFKRLSAWFKPIINIVTLVLLLFLSVFFSSILHGTINYLERSINDPTVSGLYVERKEKQAIDNKVLNFIRNISIDNSNSFIDLPKETNVQNNSQRSVFKGAWGHHNLGLKILKSNKKSFNSIDDYIVTFGISVLVEDYLLKKAKPIYGRTFVNNDENGLFISYNLLKRLGYKSLDDLSKNNKVILLYGESKIPIVFPIIGVSEIMEKDFYITEGWDYRWFHGEYDPSTKIGRFSITNFSDYNNAKIFRNIALQLLSNKDYIVEQIVSDENLYSFDIIRRYTKIDPEYVKDGLFQRMLLKYDFQKKPKLIIYRKSHTSYEPNQLEYLYITVYPKKEYLNLESMQKIQTKLEKYDCEMDFSSIHKLIQIAEISSIFYIVTQIILGSLFIFSIFIIYTTFSESISKKYKKLGVQKSVGLNSFNILSIYSVQAFYIWFFAVASFIILSAIAYTFNAHNLIIHYYNNVEITSFFAINYSLITIYFIATLLISLVSAFLAVWKFAIQKPSRLLLDKE